MKRSNRKVAIFMLVWFFVLIIPYINTILYSLPSTDDFWMAAGVEKGNLLADAIRIANEFYMNWAGDWIYIFLEVLLNPLVLFGISSKALGIEMVVFFLLFLVALFAVFHAFGKYVIQVENRLYIYGIYLLLLTWFLNTEVWTEVFYWFVGSCYMWGMIFILLTVALEIKFFYEPKVSTGIVLAVVGAIACSCYMEAVFPCMVFLIFMFMDIVEKRRIDAKKLTPFLFFLFGALGAIVAPGNFKRKNSSDDGGLQLFKALKDTLLIWLDSLFDLLKNPITIVTLILFLMLGMLVLKKTKYQYKYPVIPFALTFLCLYVTYYPIALGYGGSSYLPNRVIFIFNVFAVLGLSGSFLYLGGWLRYEKNIVLSRKNIVTAVVCLAAFSYICILPTKYYESLPYAQTVAQTKQVKLCNDEWNYLLRYIDSLEEDEVVLERAKINTPIIKSPGITADENHSINRNVANFFKKQKIKIIWW